METLSGVQSTAFVDTLTFTLPASVLIGGFGCLDTDDTDLSLATIDAILKPFGLRCGRSCVGGRNFYKVAYWLDYSDALADRTDLPSLSALGFVAFGGNNGTACVYLSGFACSFIGMSNLWPVVQQQLENNNAKITRVDCAYDCFEGEKTVDDAVAWWEAGLWTTAGGKPSRYCCHGQWLPGDMCERTFSVGSRESTKFVRVYEKGHQLGDRESKWVRWEIEYKSSNGANLPYDILTNPGHYLSTAYDCFAWIPSEKTAAASITYATKKKVKLTVEQYKKHCQQQYGKFIGTMVEMGFPVEDLLGSLSRSGIPARLIVPLTVSPDELVDNNPPF